MENKGSRHFCVEGIESIPKSSNDEVKETCVLKPQRASAKRQKLTDKIESSGSEAKRMAEIQEALAAYKKE